MSEIEGKNVTYIGEVVQKLQAKLHDAADAAMKVLPGKRGNIMVPLTDANALLKSIEEVLERSGMDKRLGFVLEDTGIKPVILKAELPDDNEG